MNSLLTVIINPSERCMPFVCAFLCFVLIQLKIKGQVSSLDGRVIDGYFFSNSNDDSSSSKLQNSTIIKLHIASPGIGIQKGLNDNISVEGSFGYVYYFTSGRFFPIFLMFPGIDVRLKYHHNFNRRIEKGKSVLGFSGNYVGLIWGYIPLNTGVFPHSKFVSKGSQPGNYLEVSNSLQLSYGLQRTFGKRKQFFTDLNICYGFGYNQVRTQLARWPYPTVQLGYMLH